MLYELFVKAISLSQEEQKRYLVETKQTHPELFDELIEMLKDDEQSKNLDTHYWSSLITNESATIVNSSEDLIGTVITAFQLTELIDKGGMGSVYKAQRCDGQFEQTVAIKIINRELEHVIGKHALIREAGFMAKLNHPNIGKVFDAGISHDGYYFIIMEYIDGCSITEKFSNSSVSLPTKLKLFCDLCDAVNHAHQMQVIHADLKPANILITQDNQVKILDFGISRMFNSRSSDSSSAYTAYLKAMTANYASPELLAGEQSTMYSDIYALGKVFLSLFNGAHNKTKYQKELDSIGGKASNPTPNERYSSVVELRKDIEDYINGYTVSAINASKWYRFKKLVFKRHPVVSLHIVSIIIVVSFLLVQLSLQNKNLTKANKQSDLMIDKLSSMLTFIDKKKTNGKNISTNHFLTTSSALLEDENLDINSKALLKLTLANSYNSNGNINQARQLYSELVNNINLLNNKDISFEAGGKLAQLLTHLYDLDKIHSEVGHLLEHLTFSDKSQNLPSTPAQAIFYHRYLDGMKYIQSEKSGRIAYGIKHTKLLQAIMDNYWEELTTQLQAETTGFLARCLYTQLEFNSNTIYYFEQTPGNYFENQLVPQLLEIETLFKKSITLHYQNNGLDDVARGELILAGLYSLIDSPQKAINSAEKSILYSHQVLGDNHPNLINRYGELSKDFLYTNPIKSIEYATTSVTLAQQFDNISHSQYLLASKALLNALEAAGEFDQYQKVSQQYFQYYLNLPDGQRNAGVNELVVEALQDFYLVMSAPPQHAKILIPLLKEYYEKNSLTKQKYKDYDKNLFSFFTALINTPDLNDNTTLVHKASLDKNYYSSLKLLREKINIGWHQTLSHKKQTSAIPLTIQKEIPWSNKESQISTFKVEVLVKIASMLTKTGQIIEAEKLLTKAQTILLNKQLLPENAWEVQIELVRSEVLLAKDQITEANLLLQKLQEGVDRHFPKNSLVRQHYQALLKVVLSK